MVAHAFHRDDATYATIATGDLPGLTISGIPSSTQTNFISGIVKTPTNQDYRVIEKLPYAATLTSFTGKTSTGSLTATLKINSNAVTAGSLAVTSSQSTTSPSGANTASSGDTLIITVSAVTTPADFSFTVVYTYTLA